MTIVFLCRNLSFYKSWVDGFHTLSCTPAPRSAAPLQLLQIVLKAAKLDYSWEKMEWKPQLSFFRPFLHFWGKISPETAVIMALISGFYSVDLLVCSCEVSDAGFTDRRWRSSWIQMIQCPASPRHSMWFWMTEYYWILLLSIYFKALRKSPHTEKGKELFCIIFDYSTIKTKSFLLTYL